VEIFADSLPKRFFLCLAIHLKCFGTVLQTSIKTQYQMSVNAVSKTCLNH
jgi:hypothetical protein